MVVVEGRVEFVRSMDAAAIDDHHDLFAGGAEGRHHLMDVLAPLLGIKMRDDLIEDFGGPILDGAIDVPTSAFSHWQVGVVASSASESSDTATP